MYIRRKVFSLLDVEGEERLFSTTDINLEDAEERIFSLNEDAEEYLFSESEDDKKMSTGKKAALATAGTLAAAGAGIYGSKLAGKAVIKQALKNSKKYRDEAASTFKNLTEEQMDDLAKKVAKELKIGKSMQKSADTVNSAVVNSAKKVKDIFKKKK